MTSSQRQEIRIVQVKDDADLAQALAIREVVFIEEQHVPEGIERDAEDASAFHLLALQGGHAVGTGRIVAQTDPPPGHEGAWGRVGRMAVLQASRKSGVGTSLLQVLEGEARRRGWVGVVLHAQVDALDFYKKHGYQALGSIFEEAGMPHLQMKKKL